MAIDATIGGATANSYVSLEDAETYFVARLRVDAWDGASAQDKEKALLQACRRIEALRLRSHRMRDDPFLVAYDTQALKFPRWRDFKDGAYFIVQPVMDAQCEEALALLSIGAEQERRQQLQQAGVKSFSVDGLSETYGASALSNGALYSAEAWQLLTAYRERGGVIATSDRPGGEWTPGSQVSD